MRLRKLPLLPLIPPASKGTPSSTISGSLLALKEAPPRIRIVLPALGEPLFDITCTPADFPLISCSGEPTSPALKSLLFTVLTEPVKSFFVILPYPTTTSSSSTFPPSVKKTSSTFPTAVSVCSSCPRKVNASCLDPAGSDMLYVPSSAVNVPTFVPTTRTETPCKGIPS